MVDDEPERSHFDILLLGPIAAYRDGVPLDTSRWQRKVGGLFHLLLTAPSGRMQKEEVIEALWPGMPADSGARNLRVVLHMLRKGLGGTDPPAIVGEGSWLALNPLHEWDIDLNRFLSLATEAEDDISLLEEAAGYYRGEPLVDERYDDWAIRVRERVHATWRDIALRLARLNRDSNDQQAALRWIDRVMDSDPLDEEALREGLSILGEQGRRTEALRRYQAFEQRLRSALDVGPSSDTLAIVTALRQDRSAHEQAGASTKEFRAVPVLPRSLPIVVDPLIGRADELGRILWMLPPSLSVGARTILVAGERGVGKTRLLAEVAERARRAGSLTLAGTCYQMERGLAYGPIHDALADYFESQPDALLTSRLGDLLPSIAEVVPELALRFPSLQEARRTRSSLSLFVALESVLQCLARDETLVLLIDDLDAADEATLELVHFLVRRCSNNRLLLVSAYTVEEGNPCIQHMVDEGEEAGWLTTLQLAPLETDDVEQILHFASNGKLPLEDRARISKQSQGNPKIALQLARKLPL